MPVDYSKYPDNWFTEIRPAILERAGDCCEHPNCGLKNKSIVISAKYKRAVVGWFKSFGDMVNFAANGEIPFKKITYKNVKVVLTIAHLDHDPENKNVSYDRLKAYCQLHHLQYDSMMKSAKRLLNGR